MAEERSVNRRRGVCKWFNIVKGYGFITPDDGSIDVFLHQTVIQMEGFRSLAEGEEVEYEVAQGERGLEASMVCGHGGADCRGSERRPVSKKRSKKVRCYNCGQYSTHIAAKCPKGPLPKRCHLCKSGDHLIADCPHKGSELETGGEGESGEEGGGGGVGGSGVGSSGESLEKSKSKDNNNNDKPDSDPKTRPSRRKS